MNCARCGRCCTTFGVCVTPSDIDRIWKATGLRPEDFVQQIPEQQGRERAEPGVLIDGTHSLLVLAWKKDRTCIFYDGKGCSAYLHRPMLCRTYPFLLKDGRLEDVSSRACENRWRPEREQEYRSDLKLYEKEVTGYRKIAAQWNKRGGGSLAGFLAFALGHLSCL